MIRINLLGYNPRAEAEKMLIVAGFISSLVVCLLLWLVLVFMARSTKETLEEKKADLQAEFTQLNRKTKSVKDLNEKRLRLREKLSIIAKLKKSKIGPVRMLDDLNIAVPAKVWLRSFDESGGLARLKGRALSANDISDFMVALDKSDYFSNVELLESKLMYYSKRTGRVTALPDKSTLENQSRKTKEGSNPQDRPKVKIQFKGVKDNHIKIQEFLLEANVNYVGALRTKQDTEDSGKSKRRRKR